MPANSVHIRTAICNTIIDYKLIAIVRLERQVEVAPLIKCLIEAGIKILEITSNTPGFEQEIINARANYPNTLIGAGTITCSAIAQKAINAGAQFIVTPNTKQDIVELAHQHNIPVLMGALTPTDVANAIEFKTDIIKLFPAGSMGVGYLKALKGPFNNAKLMPVGGVNLNNLTDWFDAGACGVAISSDFSKPINNESDKHKLLRLINAYLAKLDNI